MCKNLFSRVKNLFSFFPLENVYCFNDAITHDVNAGMQQQLDKNSFSKKNFYYLEQTLQAFMRQSSYDFCFFFFNYEQKSRMTSIIYVYTHIFSPYLKNPRVRRTFNHTLARLRQLHIYINVKNKNFYFFFFPCLTFFSP